MALLPLPEPSMGPSGRLLLPLLPLSNRPFPAVRLSFAGWLSIVSPTSELAL